MDTSNEKIRYTLQFFFDKGKNAIQAAENMNSVYGLDTVTANHAQFWFRRFRFGNFDVRDALRTGTPIVENVVEIADIVESDRHFIEISIEVPWGYLAGRWYGNREVRPILALHGWLDNLGTWSTLIPQLPQHIGILCIEFPGHGHSSYYPKGVIYHGNEFVNIIAIVMQAYKWKKVSLLGHSFGAYIAFVFTALYPHAVDMLIQIDFFIGSIVDCGIQINELAHNYEKNLIENDRVVKAKTEEPPSYTLERLSEIVHAASMRSIEIDKCKYILERNIQKSRKYSDKYYFSRDNKLKYLIKDYRCISWYEELVKRIEKVPHFVVKAKDSVFISLENVKILAKTTIKHNKYFEYHELDGTHYLHLNNPDSVATLLNPFINRWRPEGLKSWAFNDEGDCFHQNAESVSCKSRL